MILTRPAHSRERAPEWWAAALADRRRIPRDLRALLTDPRAVRATVSAPTLAWCRALPGWAAGPLEVHEPERSRPRAILVRLTAEEDAAVRAAAARTGYRSVQEYARAVLVEAGVPGIGRR